jgi:hypothetical protein
MCHQAVNSKNLNFLANLWLKNNADPNCKLLVHHGLYALHEGARACVGGCVIVDVFGKFNISKHTHFQNMTRRFLASNMTGDIIASVCVCIMLAYERK